MNALLQAARRHDLADFTRRIEAGEEVGIPSEAGVGVLSYLVQPAQTFDENDWKLQAEHVMSFLGLVDGVPPAQPYVSTASELAAQRLCIKHGVNLEATDSVGDTALAYAAYYGNQPAAELLLSAGAECIDLSGFGHSPLTYAINGGHVEIVRVMLACAQVQGRLAEIADTPAYQRSFDGVDAEILALLEWYLPDIRMARAERKRISNLKGALEWQPEPDPPIRLWLSEHPMHVGRAEMESGPILKICINCLYPYRVAYPYHGSRYGQVGGYGCPRCQAYFALIDDDMCNSQVHYDYFDGNHVNGRERLIDGPWDKADLLPITLDYALLYRLDLLQELERLHGSPLFDALRTRREYAHLAELAGIVSEAFFDARSPRHFDNRLNGQIPLPPEADAWVNLIRTLLPEETDREAWLVPDETGKRLIVVRPTSRNGP
ncbi:MAG: ankyrin repeat domain-containing protein [Magnetococcales bacterium]|nr:ankyrin repeat domain-containing protein [Magnetococcales bacterium]